MITKYHPRKFACKDSKENEDHLAKFENVLLFNNMKEGVCGM